MSESSGAGVVTDRTFDLLESHECYDCRSDFQPLVKSLAGIKLTDRAGAKAGCGLLLAWCLVPCIPHLLVFILMRLAEVVNGRAPRETGCFGLT